MSYCTVSSENFSELTFKKSKFIASVVPIHSQEEAKAILFSYGKNYADASHICYAYILETEQKASDDNEPQGTAGLPMLNVLKKKELCNILAIVVRYFGGVKLGTGGLIRAYTKAVSEALKTATFVSMKTVEEYAFILTYGELTELETLEKQYGYTVSNKKFQENVTVFIEVEEGKKEQLKQDLFTVYQKNLSVLFVKKKQKEQK